MTYLSRYRDIFGRPNTGVHSIRFMNLAVVDVLLTLLVAGLLTYVFVPRQQFGRMFIVVSITLFGLGIILHRLFDTRTTIDKYLFP